MHCEAFVWVGGLEALLLTHMIGDVRMRLLMQLLRWFKLRALLIRAAPWVCYSRVTIRKRKPTEVNLDSYIISFALPDSFSIGDSSSGRLRASKALGP